MKEKYQARYIRKTDTHIILDVAVGESIEMRTFHKKLFPFNDEIPEFLIVEMEINIIDGTGVVDEDQFKFECDWESLADSKMFTLPNGKL